MKLLVGLSLSFCIKDMIKGLVDPNDVAFISAGTRFESSYQFLEVLEKYKKGYWYKEPEAAAKIATWFYNEGRILQPRLEGQPPISLHLDTYVYYKGVRLPSHWQDYVAIKAMA